MSNWRNHQLAAKIQWKMHLKESNKKNELHKVTVMISLRDLPQGHLQSLHYTEGATGVINLIVSSSSPDSTPRSLNQTFCTNSPLTQLILLSRTRQFSLSGTSFLIVVSPEETRKMSLILAAETSGWRLRWAFPILSSVFKRSLSNTSYLKTN